ncbi:MAG: TSUP family transporter, partial [Brevundimonas sp.]|uniref:TSUP family transporter n=1 Tax=Brevundimonas sp. TaxID=1871086 RepID=UPI00391F414B
ALPNRPSRLGQRRRAGACLGVGAASGVFGVGGGCLSVPGLMAATGMGLAMAQAASLVSVAAFGATTAATYAAAGWLDPALVVAMALGGLGGAALGLPLAARLGRNVTLARRRFAGLIILTALDVAVRAVTGA